MYIYNVYIYEYIRYFSLIPPWGRGGAKGEDMRRGEEGSVKGARGADRIYMDGGEDAHESKFEQHQHDIQIEVDIKIK